MLTDVSKALGRSFFLGAFLPALVLIANAVTMIELAIEGNPITYRIGIGVMVTLCLAGAFFIATVFLSLNIYIVRLYEGYPVSGWRFLKKRLQSQRDQIYQEIAGIKGELNKQLNQQGSYEANLRLNRLQQEADERYPPPPAEVLPSSLGNIIRAFEHYPFTRYSIEPIAVWPRLLAVVPENQTEAINTQKSLMDFWLNLSLVCLVSGLFWAVVVVWYVYISSLFLVPVLVVSILLAYLSYRGAIPCAVAWGYEVRTAFDLYRSDLLQRLGIQKPSSISDERNAWQKVFWFFRYEDYAKRHGLPSPDSSGRTEDKAS